MVGHERLAAVIHRKVVPGSSPQHKFCLSEASTASTAKIPAEAATQCAGRVDSSANRPARKRSSTGLHCSIWVRQKIRDPKKSIADHFPHENCFVSCELTMTSPIDKTMSFGKATAHQKLDDSRLHQRSSHTLIKREVEHGGHWGAAPIVVLSLIVQGPTPLYTYFKIHKTSGVLPL